MWSFRTPRLIAAHPPTDAVAKGGSPSKSIAPTYAVIWIAVIAIGIAALAKHDVTPGDSARAEIDWPGMGVLPSRAGIPVLVMAVHPRCPCTRASLAELSNLLSRPHRVVSVYVLFAELPGMETQSFSGELWNQASAIAGVTLVRDVNGAISDRFGAKNSGQTYLYDGQGTLRFCGGITSSRGHQGDNIGASAIASALDPDALAPRGRPTVNRPPITTPVFGCSLR